MGLNMQTIVEYCLFLHDWIKTVMYKYDYCVCNNVLYASFRYLTNQSGTYPLFFKYYLSVKWICWTLLCNLNQGSLFAFDWRFMKLHGKISLSLEISIVAFSLLWTSQKMLKNCILTYVRSYFCCNKKKKYFINFLQDWSQNQFKLTYNTFLKPENRDSIWLEKKPCFFL